MPPSLKGKVALVTGASRGVGKGVALGLGEAGATVYVTGRTTQGGQSAEGLPGTIHDTAAEVGQLGGEGFPLRCDHTVDEEVQSVFKIIVDRHGRIDILVNAVWGGYEFMSEIHDGDSVYTWERPFWEQPLWRWDAMFRAGVRAHYFASQLAARSMVAQQQGLIVNISYWAAQKHMGNVAYGVAKAATDKMTRDTAHELKDHHVTVVSLYPGLVRTESVMRFAQFFDMRNSESPQFLGRVVSALATDPHRHQETGKILVAAELGRRYGLVDVDGRSPRPLSLNEA